MILFWTLSLNSVQWFTRHFAIRQTQSAVGSKNEKNTQPVVNTSFRPAVFHRLGKRTPVRLWMPLEDGFLSLFALTACFPHNTEDLTSLTPWYKKTAWVLKKESQFDCFSIILKYPEPYLILRMHQDTLSLAISGCLTNTGCLYQDDSVTSLNQWSIPSNPRKQIKILQVRAEKRGNVFIKNKIVESTNPSHFQHKMLDYKPYICVSCEAVQRSYRISCWMTIQHAATRTFLSSSL